jgi:uncharacterized protein YkwD
LALVHVHVPSVDEASARVLFADVNASRAHAGLPQLTYDAQLAQIALDVARDMATRHYFGHTDPNGVTFEERLRTSGYHYRFAAENMAFDQDEQHANQAFLHSPGHYRNIMDPLPHKLGVAVVSAGDGQTFFVEEFAN